MAMSNDNTHGHNYSHNEMFSNSKKKAWRPKHHELAFGKATTCPPWYRNAKYGGISHIPPAIAGLRYESKDGEGANNQPKGKFMYHHTGESDYEMKHSSNTIKGKHEEGIRNQWNKEVLEQKKLTNNIRQSNLQIHVGNETRSLIKRYNTNSTLQPLYPMSVVNDSFNKHSQARSIDQASAPKPENNRYVHLTQKMYLPYERTRSDFPNSDPSTLKSLARDNGPNWWPGRESN